MSKKSGAQTSAGRSSKLRTLASSGIVVAALAVALSIAWAKGAFHSAAVNEKESSIVVENPLTNVAASSTTALRGAGMEAMDEAAKDKKYLFAFFWKADDSQTAAMRKVFERATETMTDRARTVSVHVTDPAEAGIVQQFGLNRAPMPLVLAIAPNGAITGGFPTKFEEKDLRDALVSPGLEKCMKALQDGKLVFLCAQNASTKSNAEALKGVNEFRADARFAGATEIVMLDPSDSAEAAFLGDLQINPKTTVAVTAMLAPPGSPIAEFEGPTSKDELLAALQTAGSCGPGGACGPGGCGPM